MIVVVSETRNNSLSLKDNIDSDLVIAAITGRDARHIFRISISVEVDRVLIKKLSRRTMAAGTQLLGTTEKR
jgi:hypothetical protein